MSDIKSRSPRPPPETAKRGPGRPVVRDGASVSTWMPSYLRKHLTHLADQNGASLSATIRALLTLQLKK